MHSDYYLIPNADQEPKQEQAIFSSVCPHCHKQTAFETVGVQDKIIPLQVEGYSRVYGNYTHCIRRCPVCLGGVFILASVDFDNNSYEVIRIFPEPKPQFNREGLSKLLQELFDECLACYQAGYYRASAIMLRRCLEQICAEAGITGGTLHSRLELFKPKVPGVDERLYKILFDLKSLGNDAAHANLSDFDNVGQREVHLAVEIFKKVIDSFYQTEILLSEFQALKKSAGPP